MYAVSHEFHDHPEEKILRKFPFLEVWLDKITTIHGGVKGQQAIESYHDII